MRNLALLAFLALLPGCKFSEVPGLQSNTEELKKSIFPISPNWTLRYSIAIFGSTTFGIPCTAGTVTRTIRGTATLQGRSGTWLPQLCTTNATNTAYSVDGDQVYEWNGSEWNTFISAPLTDGRTFLAGLKTYTWFQTPNQTVPAGTFSDCWTRKDTRSDSFDVFCRGVGLIRSHNVGALATNGWRATLENAVGPTVARTQSGEEETED